MFERWARSPRLMRYARQYRNVEGWFNRKSVLLWDAFLEFQERADIRGHFLEIGVYRGKSAFLSTLYSRPDEQCWFIDLHIDPDFRRSMETLKPENAHYLEMSSFDLDRHAHACFQEAGRFRWIHIDGNHGERAVLNDLQIASELLGPDGVVVVDDFLCASWPGVSEGVFRYLHDHGNRLALFLSGFNKGYLVQVDALDRYRDFVRDGLSAHLRSRRFRDFSLFAPGAADTGGSTPSYGIGKRFRDRDVVVSN